MTKLDDAERKIIREWDAWASNQSDPATLHDGFPFYRHLLKERSELLKFRYTKQMATCVWVLAKGWTS